MKMRDKKLIATLAFGLITIGIGAQAYASPIWNLTGTYTTVGFWNGGSNEASVTVTTMNLQTGNFSGTSFVFGWDPSWTGVLSGVETGNTFTFYATYPAHNDWGTETGTIDADGSLISLNWVDRYGVNAIGWSIEGHATPIAPPTPIPSAIWLVGSALAGLFGFCRKLPVR